MFSKKEDIPRLCRFLLNNKTLMDKYREKSYKWFKNDMIYGNQLNSYPLRAQINLDSSAHP